jgi:hypothetical protein
MNNTLGRPCSIRIFLADGTPDGLRIVEKSNWTGRAVVSSRSQIDRALARAELAQPGVYVLTGVGEDGSPRIYVGEADVLRDRIRQHVASKEFWTRLVAFSSTNEGLNKAHVRYLESRLIGLAKKANQWDIENATAPASPPLSEADRADAEWFLAEMLLIFPILNIDAFEIADERTRVSSQMKGDMDLPLLFLDERGAKGQGREAADGFVVLKGSQARASEVESIHEYLRDLRRQLIEREVMVSDGDRYIFTQDFRFGSPSTAAGVLVGASANGRVAWRNEKGVTLKELQQCRVDAIPEL